MSRTAADPRPCVEVTCLEDTRAHQVDDITFAADPARASGLLPAICGHRIVAAPLAHPPGRPCSLCAAVLGFR